MRCKLYDMLRLLSDDHFVQRLPFAVVSTQHMKVERILFNGHPVLQDLDLISVC